jgi:hypothetical protein
MVELEWRPPHRTAGAALRVLQPTILVSMPEPRSSRRLAEQRFPGTKFTAVTFSWQ